MIKNICIDKKFAIYQWQTFYLVWGQNNRYHLLFMEMAIYKMYSKKSSYFTGNNLDKCQSKA